MPPPQIDTTPHKRRINNISLILSEYHLRAARTSICLMDVPLDFSQILPDRACSILHRALRDPHEALRFLTILFDCCLPELGIYLLRFRQRLAGLKCPEQMVVFAQPRHDESDGALVG